MITVFLTSSTLFCSPQMISFLQSFKRCQLISLLLQIYPKKSLPQKTQNQTNKQMCGEAAIYPDLPQTFFPLFQPLSSLEIRFSHVAMPPSHPQVHAPFHFPIGLSPTHRVLQNGIHRTTHFLSKYVILCSIYSKTNW